MKKMLQISLVVAVLSSFIAVASDAADKAELQRKIGVLKRHRAEQVQLMEEANLIDLSLGESYKGVIDADDRKIADLEGKYAAYDKLASYK